MLVTTCETNPRSKRAQVNVSIQTENIPNAIIIYRKLVKYKISLLFEPLYLLNKYIYGILYHTVYSCAVLYIDMRFKHRLL